MGQRDDEVRLLAQGRDVQPGGVHDVLRAHLPAQMVAVPMGDLRRQEADHADLQLVFAAVFGGEFALQQQSGGQAGRAVGVQVIGRAEGEIRPGDGLAQEVQPVIEFMVAERGGIKAHGVHGADGGVDAIGGEIARHRHVIGQRVALDDVPIVEQHGIGRPGPRGGGQGGDFGQPDALILLVAEIVVILDEAMQVRGFQQAQADDRGGVGEGSGRCQRRGLQQGAARQV